MLLMMNKAQTLAEISVLLGVVVLAFTGMQVYIKRGLQARYKTSVDAAVSMAQKSAEEESGLLQYEPYYQDQAQKSTAKQADVESFETSEGQQRKLQRKEYLDQSIERSSVLGVKFEEDDHWEESE